MHKVTYVRCRYQGSLKTYDYKTLHPPEALQEGEPALVRNGNGSCAVVLVEAIGVAEDSRISYSWLLAPLHELIADELADIEAYHNDLEKSA